MTDSSDCDDQDNDVYPQAQEFCNNEDDDCDGTVDEPDALSFITWYEDLDGDGYGNDLVNSSECTQPAGYVTENGDCDDTDPGLSPGAVEICDEIDNNCDGTIDENLTFGSDADLQVWIVKTSSMQSLLLLDWTVSIGLTPVAHLHLKHIVI